MQITRELFERQRHPRFGNANPQRMDCTFWEWMIRGEHDISPDRECKLAESGLLMRDGKLKSASGPHRARDLFDIPTIREDGPIWTFDRMGATRTGLPDGRVVCVGGEHEDFYDPDFCIYNDVVVFGPGERIDIYGYPRELFPPTDFHTATLTGDRIVIIGSVGYKDERQSRYTPVYVLHLNDFHVSKLETTGEMPGWISEHQAELETADMIAIRDGKVMRDTHKGHCFVRNLEHFSLNLKTGCWSRLTNRK